MADINSIFKSDLDENQKHARLLFGRLLISLRNNDYMKIYSLMSGVSDQKFDGSVLTLVFSDNNSYLMLNNSGDIEDINSLLDSIESGVKIKLESSNAKEFDEYKFEEYLKEEFGKILTIK